MLTVSTRRTLIKAVEPILKNRGYHDVAIFYAFNPNIIFIPKKIGDYFPNLQKFVITKSSLKYIEWRDFKNMKQLKALYLNENKIERVSSCAFQYLENLEIINLEGNRIVSLNEQLFINLPNLTSVSFNENIITELDTDLFQNNPKLKDMLFRDNKITAIRINFRQHRALKFIDFRQNTCINVSFKCCDYFNEFISNVTEKCEGPGNCN